MCPPIDLPPCLQRARVRQRAGARRVLKAGAEVGEHRLGNGMRVLVAERHSDPVVAVLLLYRVGSRNEREHEAGMSHFLEHMMFKGSRRFGKGEVDRLTTELGGQNNAFTGYDHTAYWFELASDRWEAALEIEADRMGHLVIDPAEFDSERAVVLEEWAMGEDDPWRVLARRVEAALFQRHPYARPIIGTPESLRAMRPADMRAFHERFYHPGNATLVVCGDVAPRRALAAVRERFEALAPGMPFEAADCFRPALEEPGGETRLSMTWQDPGKRLIVAWPTDRVGSEADYAMDLALTVLSSGRLSRLQRRLVLEEGLATSVSAMNDSRVEAGAFWLYVECAQETVPAELERVVDEELARLARERVGKAELERALSLIRSSEAFDGESVSDVAEELGEYAVDADWRMAFDQGARHAKVTPAALRAAVARYLVPARRVVGWCLPPEETAEQRQARPRRTSRKRPARRRAARR